LYRKVIEQNKQTQNILNKTIKPLLTEHFSFSTRIEAILKTAFENRKNQIFK